MTQDRAHSDSSRVTNEFLAFMLGMRRVRITTAAAELQRQRSIKYRRRLEAAACSCHAADRKVYARLMH